MEKNKKKIIAGIGVLGAAAAAYFLTKKAPELHYCPYCDAGFATYEELMAHIAAEHPTEEAVGRFQGYVLHAETGSKISSARIYVDGVFHAYSVAPHGNYQTDYVPWGSHTIKVEADNYETAEFPVTLEESLMNVDLEMLPLEEAPTEWTEGIEVRKITVEPSIAYVGETIEIKVYINYPYPLPPLPVNIYGSVLVNGTQLTGCWTLDSYGTVFRFQYSTTHIGEFVASAADKSAHFTVLTDIPATYYSPFGGVRMPKCTKIEGGQPVEWNPTDAVVTDWVTFSQWFGTAVLALEYTCKEYWDSKDELATMIGGRSFGVSIPSEFHVLYGTTCKTCGGTGQVICTREMRHCRSGEMTKCRECNGMGKMLKVDLTRGIRDWVKSMKIWSICGGGYCRLRIRCPHCDRIIEGPSRIRGSASDRPGLVRKLLQHIEERHSNYPLTEPAYGPLFSGGV